MKTDPFENVRTLADRRSEVDWALRDEIANLRAAGYSTRAIASVIGLSHDTVWRWSR
jgi:IS30 family transposase